MFINSEQRDSHWVTTKRYPMRKKKKTQHCGRSMHANAIITSNYSSSNSAKHFVTQDTTLDNRMMWIVIFLFKIQQSPPCSHQMYRKLFFAQIYDFLPRFHLLPTSVDNMSPSVDMHHTTPQNPPEHWYIISMHPDTYNLTSTRELLSQIRYTCASTRFPCSASLF